LTIGAHCSISLRTYAANLIASKLCETSFSLYASVAYLKRQPAPPDPKDLRGHGVIGYHASLSAAPPSIRQNAVLISGARMKENRTCAPK
jgi:hypothetical protein